MIIYKERSGVDKKGKFFMVRGWYLLYFLPIYVKYHY